MHGNVTSLPNVKPKTRTITLTNRAPIRIVEDDWPILAQGYVGQGEHGDEYGWTIQIILRKHREKRELYDVHEIIHAKYEYRDPMDEVEPLEAKNQTVRVGRMLAFYDNLVDGRLRCQSIDDIWRHIRETGDELRERITNVEHRRQVVNAIDKLFADLPPHDLKE